MRLIELQINAFGQFNNRRFVFEPGLTIIYGENEQGKSTLLACLKAMFFGFTGRGRSIRDNDRLRYQPWNGKRMSANLVFEHAGVRYRLERSFGKTRAADKCILMNDITGRTIELPSQQEVGPALFQVTAEEFANTVFIGQLQSPIDSPDHSTLGKLANLSGSLDEGLSHNALDSQLLKAQVKLKAERGNGGLIPDLQRQIDQLESQRQVAIDYESEQQERILNLDDLQQQIAAGETALMAAKAWQARVSLSEKAELLEKLKNRRRDLDQLASTWQDQLEGLRIAGRIIEQADIERFRDQLHAARRHQSDLDNQRRIVGEHRTSQIQEEAVVRGFDNLQGIDRPLLDRISGRIEALHLEAERIRLAQQQADLALRVQQSRSSLEQRLADQNQLEQEYQATLTSEKTGSETETRRSSQGSRLLFALALVLMIAGLATGWLIHPLLYALAAAGLILMSAIGYDTVHSRAAQQTAAHLAEEIRRGELDALRDKLEQARAQTATARLILAQDEQLLAPLLDPLKSKIGQGLGYSGFSEDDLIRIQTELDGMKSELDGVLTRSNCASLLDLHIRLNELAQAKQALERRKQLVERETATENQLADLAEAAWRELASSLQMDAEPNPGVMGNWPEQSRQLLNEPYFEQKIDSLARKIIEISSLKRQLEQQQDDFREITGGQAWDVFLNKAEAELEKFSALSAFTNPSDSASSYEMDSAAEKVSAADMATSIEARNQQIAEWRLAAAALESAIRHSPRTPLMAAEYDDLIRQLRGKLQDMKSYYDSLVLARDMFQAAYDEMQATFGPVLNEKAAETLRQLTGSRYQNLKIDRSFDVRVESPDDGSFHEWDYFSGGTVDQIYLALRLAISDLIQASDAHLPLLLDDIFVQYDDERAAAGLKYLEAKVNTENIQALLLTSHSRMNEMASAINLLADGQPIHYLTMS